MHPWPKVAWVLLLTLFSDWLRTALSRDFTIKDIIYLHPSSTVPSLMFYFVILADAFIQSDLHMCDLQCIHVLHFTFTLMAHCTSGAIRGSVSCSRTLRQGIELATF